jgi:hypothetical protein
MFSTHVTQIPTYLIVNQLGMIDSLWALIIPKLAAPLSLFLIEQFVTQLPDPLLEAAKIDGANQWVIFRKIVMPFLAPAWSTLIVFSFVAGVAVAAPSGWLLAYLAALPFLLGLFFFLLLGLIVGATIYRVGSKAPVPTTATLWVLGSSAACVLMLVSLYTEYRALPRSLEKKVRDSIFESLPDPQREELHRGVSQFVATELATNYSPGGFPGYLRWAATNGRFKCPRILRASTVEFRLSHQRTLWMVRVGLSLLMAEWTIMSQVLGLRPRPPRDEAEQSGEPAETAGGG